MHKNKIICGTVINLSALNDNVDKAAIEGYEAIDISTSGHAGEICVLLCKKV